MKVLNEDAGKGMGNTFGLILNRQEARTLMAIVEEACKANKRRSTFRAWKKKLEERLSCF